MSVSLVSRGSFMALSLVSIGSCMSVSLVPRIRVIQYLKYIYRVKIRCS